MCLSINGLLNTKNDLSLRWTGCLTETLLSKSHGCSLISWMTGQFLPSAMYKTSNFWKGNFTSQSTASHIYVLLIFFFFIFVLAHSHVGASYEALRMNRTLHTLCKRNGISTPWRFLLWNCVDHCYGFTNYSVPLMNFSPWNLQSDRICIYLIAHLGFSFIHSGRRSFQIISYFNSTA